MSDFNQPVLVRQAFVKQNNQEIMEIKDMYLQVCAPGKTWGPGETALGSQQHTTLFNLLRLIGNSCLLENRMPTTLQCKILGHYYQMEVWHYHLL